MGRLPEINCDFFIMYLVGGEGLDCSFIGICCEIWSPLGCLYFNAEVSQVRKDLPPPPPTPPFSVHHKMRQLFNLRDLVPLFVSIKETTRLSPYIKFGFGSNFSITTL